jgi:tellurite resistance protein TerC
VKLVFHALHVNELPFINGGEPLLWVPEIPIWLSLLFIAATIVVATVASLLKTRGDEHKDDRGPIHNEPRVITADQPNEESEVDKKAVPTAKSK